MVSSNEGFFDIGMGWVDLGEMVPKKRSGTAQRIARLREVMGFDSQMAFAAFLGVGYERYNNVERGLPLSSSMASIIVRKCPGVTRDWLLDGDASTLAPKMAKALSEPLKGSQGG